MDDEARPSADGEATSVDDEATSVGNEARRNRRRLVWLVTPIVVLTVIGTVGTALSPTLAVRHPLLLILLDARNRYLVPASRRVDFVPFLLVATARRMLSDPLYYLLGRRYGDAAVRWIEKRGGGGELVRFIERLFARASYVMVFLFPGAVVCALAGQTGMHPGVFLALNLAGTVAVVLVLRASGDVLGGPVDSFLSFLGRHLLLTTSITVASVVVWLIAQKLQGNEERRAIDTLAKEIDAEQAPEPANSGRSEIEEGVEADGEASTPAHRLDGEQDARHE